MKRILIGIAVIALVGAAGVSAYYATRPDNTPRVSTTAVTRGDVVEVVVSTGTVESLTTVQVGSQVSGNVAWLGADFNSVVHKGEVIAKLDPSLLEAQVRQSRANVTRAQADVERSRVQLTDARQKLDRATLLAARQIIATSDLDAAKLAVESAEADMQAARAQLVQAEAALNQNEVNVTHTVITAPIDGIVIERSVDVGQTVAASLQSPTLFQIAADLTKMRLKASIDEADMGRVRPGQAVRFTVDAYPEETFTGAVSQVRLQPTVTQNVTTYASIIDVANPEVKLKPGMTANIRIEIARRTGVLRVPNAALRFRPTEEIFAALKTTGSSRTGDAARARGTGAASATRETAGLPFGSAQAKPLGSAQGGQAGGSASGTPGPQTRGFTPGSNAGGGKAVWVYSEGSLTPVPVRLGITDGTATELLEAPFEAGTLLVTDVSLTTTETTTGTTTRRTTSPLLPSRPTGGPGGPPPM